MSSTEGGESGSLTSKISNLYFPPRSASWIEEMEKRSDRHIRDLVTQPASQGLSENEIGCARISMMARKELNRSMQGPDTDAQDQPPPFLTFGLQRTAGPYRCANERPLRYAVSSLHTDASSLGLWLLVVSAAIIHP